MAEGRSRQLTCPCGAFTGIISATSMKALRYTLFAILASTAIPPLANPGRGAQGKVGAATVRAAAKAARGRAGKRQS